MTRWQLIKALHKSHPGLKMATAQGVVESMFEVMVEAFEREMNVSIVDLGCFRVKTKKAYTTRNPTYLRKMVGPTHLIFFKTYRILRVGLNNSID